MILLFSRLWTRFCYRALKEQRYPDVVSRAGDKYQIRPAGSDVTWLAGLYRMEDIGGIRVPVFVVLTKEPWDGIRFIHDRMPVILPGEALEEWIAPEGAPEIVLHQALTEMEYEAVSP